MLQRARHLVAAQLKKPGAFPRLADSLRPEDSPRLRELGQPPAGHESGERDNPMRIAPELVSPDLQLPERWDGLA